MKERYHLLDTIRGIVLISMIAYHGVWDLVYIVGKPWGWYEGTAAYLWQQSICWTFIFLSGFCWSLGRYPLKRGLIVFGGGALVTLVTLIAMPENRVVFGILTLIGTSMLLMIPAHKLLGKIKRPWVGLLSSGILFAVSYILTNNQIGWMQIEVPDTNSILFNGILTFLGFSTQGFYSTDYFPLIPWFFLYVEGYFLHEICKKSHVFDASFWRFRIGVFALFGKHSLLIYLLHQPVLFALCQLL